MKKFYRISWDIDSSPMHLIKSMMLAFYVMLFINIFIGSMGGIPTFVGFLLAFYLLRGMVLAGNRIGHQLALESKTEVKYMFANYLISYLMVWAVMKLLQMLSKVTGWGNINGLTISEYMKNLYGTTMLERWAYLFTGILMFAFVISLFPLVLIRRKKHWIRYFITDSMLFAVVCFTISRISMCFVAKELRRSAVCILDVMLLCKMKSKWEPLVYIVAIVLFSITMAELIFVYSVKIFSPRKGTKEIPAGLLELESPEKIRKRRIRWCSLAVVVLAIAVAGVGHFFFAPNKKNTQYRKVAECLTSDVTLGPMLYGEDLYVPISYDLDLLEKGRAVGYLAYKGEDCDSRFYQLAISNMIYTSRGSKAGEFVQLDGAETNSYQRLDLTENIAMWRKDKVFLLWDEDWSSESTYSKEITGYSECDADLIRGLESEFGAVEYNPEDFQSYDAIFTIRGYDDMREVIESEMPYGDWVGCILVKDNNFYYGNFKNRITGVKLSTLLQVLGGN